ncbi:hypothetical protein Tco_1452655 [Tanacetum coccineum]
MIAYCLITGTKVNTREIIYSDVATKLTSKSRHKSVSYPRLISFALEVLLGSDNTPDETFGSSPTILSNSNFSKDLSKVTEIELTAPMIAVNNQKDSMSPLPFSGKKKKVKSPTPADKGLPSMTFDEGTVKTTPLPEGPRRDNDLEGLKPLVDMEPLTNPVADPLGTALLLSNDEMAQESDNEEVFTAGKEMDEDIPPTDEEVQITEDQWEKHEEATVSYDDLKATIEGYYEENVDHRDQTEKLVQATMNSLEKNSKKGLIFSKH